MAASDHDGLPLGQGGRTSFPVVFAADDVALLAEVVMHPGMNRREFLQRLHASEAGHRPLASSEWQVGVFSPVVQFVPAFLTVGGAELSHRGGVRAEAVCYDGLWSAVPLQRFLDEFQCCSLVACRRDVGLKHFAFVVDGAPKVLHLAVDVGYAALRVTNISSRRHRQCVN